MKLVVSWPHNSLREFMDRELSKASTFKHGGGYNGSVVSTPNQNRAKPVPGPLGPVLICNWGGQFKTCQPNVVAGALSLPNTSIVWYLEGGVFGVEAV